MALIILTFTFYMRKQIGCLKNTKDVEFMKTLSNLKKKEELNTLEYPFTIEQVY